MESIAAGPLSWVNAGLVMLALQWGVVGGVGSGGTKGDKRSQTRSCSQLLCRFVLIFASPGANSIWEARKGTAETGSSHLVSPLKFLSMGGRSRDLGGEG